jgi:hypothetical protein
VVTAIPVVVEAVDSQVAVVDSPVVTAGSQVAAAVDYPVAEAADSREAGTLAVADTAAADTARTGCMRLALTE